ncbi:MAG: hypothetical protein JNN07_10440 [Verrucomicrobiales bacterium]|nr:hypothetical protein [Verrucomicrobiales bacterium]
MRLAGLGVQTAGDPIIADPSRFNNSAPSPRRGLEFLTFSVEAQPPPQEADLYEVKSNRFHVFLLLVAMSLLAWSGCDKGPQRMEHPEDPDGRYKLQISAARRLLAQKENWADRAEWEVVKRGDSYEVTAWRVEHPEKKGAMRYLPWGYSTILIDSRGTPVHYRRKG